MLAALFWVFCLKLQNKHFDANKKIINRCVPSSEWVFIYIGEMFSTLFIHETHIASFVLTHRNQSRVLI